MSRYTVSALALRYGIPPDNVAERLDFLIEKDLASGAEDGTYDLPLTSVTYFLGFPETRGDCKDGERPCPHMTCRHHLANNPTLAKPFELHLKVLDPGCETCSLDVADRGGHTLEAVAEVLDCTRERVRQIEARAQTMMFRRLQKEAREGNCSIDSYLPSELSLTAATVAAAEEKHHPKPKKEEPHGQRITKTNRHHAKSTRRPRGSSRSVGSNAGGEERRPSRV